MISRLFHIILILSVLSSSTGLVLGKHHCQRMERALMEGTTITSCADMGGCKKGCCSKKSKYFHLDQDQQLPQISAELPICPSFVVDANFFWHSSVIGFSCQSIFQYIHLPPDVKKDISALFQVYRC